MTDSKSGKPFLFLDVDGVLNLQKPREHFKSRVKTKVDGHKFVYDLSVVDKLPELSEIFEIVWASKGWRGREDTYLSPIFSLPTALKQLPLPGNPEDYKNDEMLPEKLDEIRRFAGDRPCAVVDDKGGQHIEDWVADRLNTIFIQPNPHRGLKLKDIKKLESFAANIHV